MKKGILFLLVFILGLNLVSAGFFKELIGGLNLSQEDLIIVKYVLTAFVILLLYYIFNSVGFPENKIFQFISAVAVGFLATAFIKPEEIWVIVQTYVSLFLAIIVALVLFGFYMIYRFFRRKPKPFPDFERQH